MECVISQAGRLDRHLVCLSPLNSSDSDNISRDVSILVFFGGWFPGEENRAWTQELVTEVLRGPGWHCM